jgi:hypothetical protein
MPEPPTLTSDGIQRLIDQLDKDLSEVENSGIPAASKQQIQAKIKAAQGLLKEGQKNLNAVANGSFAAGWAAAFSELTALLMQPLGLQSATGIGACFYRGGCAVMTKLQCAQAGGDFKPGVDCDGNPLT